MIFLVVTIAVKENEVEQLARQRCQCVWKQVWYLSQRWPCWENAFESEAELKPEAGGHVKAMGRASQVGDSLCKVFLVWWKFGKFVYLPRRPAWPESNPRKVTEDEHGVAVRVLFCRDLQARIRSIDFIQGVTGRHWRASCEECCGRQHFVCSWTQ